MSSMTLHKASIGTPDEGFVVIDVESDDDMDVQLSDIGNYSDPLP